MEWRKKQVAVLAMAMAMASSVWDSRQSERDTHTHTHTLKEFLEPSSLLSFFLLVFFFFFSFAFTPGRTLPIFVALAKTLYIGPRSLDTSHSHTDRRTHVCLPGQTSTYTRPVFPLPFDLDFSFFFRVGLLHSESVQH